MQSAHRMMHMVGAAVLLCGFQAHAATFVSTGTPTPSAGSETAFTTAGGTATVLAQEFTLTETVTVESVSVYGVRRGGSVRVAATRTPLWDWAELETVLSDIEDQPETGVEGWHALRLVETITLEAGEHVLSLHNDAEDGFEWRTVDALTGVNVGARGRGVAGGVLFFESDPVAPIFALQVNGHAPSQGGIALAALTGAGLLRRRR